MRFTRRKKTLILLYLNLVLTITALGSFTYTTMAWFMSERTRQIHVSSVQVAAPGFTVDNFTCYGVDVIQKETSTTNITFVNEEVNILPRYDSQGIVYSRFLWAIVVHVEFTYIESVPIVFSAITNQEIFSTGTASENTYDDNFMSNCIQITPSLGTTLSGLWESATISYTNTDTKSFVSVSSTPTKVTSLAISTINPGATECWFVLEYDEAIMNYIESARMMNEKPVIYQDDIVYKVDL